MSQRTVQATIAIPAEVVVQAPPPMLVSRVNADFLGMTPDRMTDVLRAMQRDPKYHEAIVGAGKFRSAPPSAVIAFLRERQLADVPSNGPANDPQAAEPSEDDQADALLGYRPTPAPASAPRAVSSPRRRS
jgi:hypothetical protein